MAGEAQGGWQTALRALHYVSHGSRWRKASNQVEDGLKENKIGRWVVIGSIQLDLQKVEIRASGKRDGVGKTQKYWRHNICKEFYEFSMKKVWKRVSWGWPSSCQPGSLKNQELKERVQEEAWGRQAALYGIVCSTLWLFLLSVGLHNSELI